MSSDPIEVLRSLRGKIGLDGGGPFLPGGRVTPDRTANVDAAIDAAIASLSAPKPESAEAWKDSEGQVWASMDEVPPQHLPPERTFRPLIYGDTAPPRAEASDGEWVPVRRSDLLEWASDWQVDHGMGDGDIVTPFDGYLLSAPKPESDCTCPHQDAREQHGPECPAKPERAEAVTGDMVERAVEAYWQDCASDREYVDSAHADRGHMRAALEAAFTAPPRPEASASADIAGLCKEASAVLEAVGSSGVALPDSWRWPLVDELAGVVALAQQPAAVDQALPDFLDRIAQELIERDNLPGSIAPGIAASLQGRACVVRKTLAGQQQGGQ